MRSRITVTLKKEMENYSLYDFDGKLKSMVNYKNELVHGPAVYYNEQFKWAEGGFLKGKRYGKWVYFNSKINKPKPQIEYEFKSDSVVKMVYHGSNNSRKWEGYFLHEKKERNWVLFNVYDQKIAEHNYNYGFRNGLSITHRSGGALESKGYYTAGIKTGNWNYYNNNNKVVYTESYSENILVNDNYLEQVSEIGAAHEQAYYNDDSKLGTAGLSMHYNLLGRSFYSYKKTDQRSLLPIPSIETEYRFQQHKSKAKVGFNDIPEEFELSAAAFLTSSMWRRKGDPEIFLPGVYLLRMELGCFDELISNELIRKLGTEQDR